MIFEPSSKKGNPSSNAPGKGTFDGKGKWNKYGHKAEDWSQASKSSGKGGKAKILAKASGSKVASRKEFRRRREKAGRAAAFQHYTTTTQKEQVGQKEPIGVTPTIGIRQLDGKKEHGESQSLRSSLWTRVP